MNWRELNHEMSDEKGGWMLIFVGLICYIAMTKAKGE